MPDYFETELRTGTAQVVEAFAPPSAEAVRGYSARRVRRNRAGALLLVLLIGGTAFGASRPFLGHGATTGPAAVHTSSPSPVPSPRATASYSGGETVSVQLTPPAHYAASTSNKVVLTIVNPGAARHVVVEFTATDSMSRYWVEPCDSGVGGGCSTQAYADNALKVAKGASTNRPGVVDFDLDLPTGTSSFNAWVDPPNGLTSYTMRVLDGSTVLAQSGAESISYSFPLLSTTSQASTTLARGGSNVGFTTVIDDQTKASYVDMESLMSVSCKAGNSAVSLPSGAYTLEWYDGASWAKIGAPRPVGQFSYELTPGESTSTDFRISVSSSMPADVTSCQITQLVSASVIWTAPYYDQSAPHAQTTVNFTVR